MAGSFFLPLEFWEVKEPALRLGMKAIGLQKLTLFLDCSLKHERVKIIGRVDKIHANPGGIYPQTKQDLGAYCADHHRRIFDVQAPMHCLCEFTKRMNVTF